MSSAVEDLRLSHLVDMALGSPETGAVNFNILNTLLHHIVDKLNIGDTVIDHEKLKIGQKSARSRLADLDGSESVITIDSGFTREGTQLNSDLVDRLSTVEHQLDALNSLPTNKDFFDQYFNKGKSDSRAVSDMFQTVHLKKRADANEDGVRRLSSLVEELMKEMNKIKRENEELRNELKDLSSMKSLWDKINGLEAQMSDVKNSLSNFANKDVFKNFVTWESLEKALKGIREDMARMTSPPEPERIVINMATDPMSRPQSPGPSEALREMLECIGKLTNRHEKLDGRVVKLEEEMPHKADRSELDGLKVPDDLLKQISDLKSKVEQMLTSRNRDAEALSRIREVLNHLQSELERLVGVSENLTEGNKDILAKLAELQKVVDLLEDKKADKAYLDSRLEPKADKLLLDAKVNFTLFDDTTGKLHSSIEDLLTKLLATEDDLRRLLNALGGDIDGKLDRLELEALKDWLEKRLKALAAKIKSGGPMTDFNEDDAAGLRKQLLQHFHCISCDRPLDVMPHPPQASLPEKPALTVTKSLRPYTTFELDAIRQHAKSLNAGDMVDAYYTPRAAGGSHTVTHPNKRITRMSAMPYLIEDDYVPAAAGKVPKDEMDIQGMDGHIYKGRMERMYNEVQKNTDKKLPPVSGAAKQRAVSPRPKTSPKETIPNTESARPVTGKSRPLSARSAGTTENGLHPQTPYGSEAGGQREEPAGNVQA